MHMAVKLYVFNRGIITFFLIGEIIIYMDNCKLFELNMQQKIMKNKNKNRTSKKGNYNFEGNI